MSRRAHNIIVKIGRAAVTCVMVGCCAMVEMKLAHGIIILASSAFLVLSVIADER